MNPYYTDGTVTLFHGDCRDILPRLTPPDTIVTDPVWPNADGSLFGADDPQAMFRSMWQALPAMPIRAAVQLGCDSDPRFLGDVPDALPFFRVAWLEVALMGRKGRLGYTSDVAYLFGVAPPSRPGQHLIPGRITDADPGGKTPGHPTPRKLRHVQWLVHWWSAPDDLIVDPFAGSGTTLHAAKCLGRRAVGIEVEERFCEAAARRLADQTPPLEIAA